MIDDPFNWQGPLTGQNITAVVEALRNRLQAHPYTVCRHNPFLGRDHYEEHFAARLRGEDPIHSSIVGQEGMFHVSDTSFEQVWGARTDSKTALAFLDRGIVLQYQKDGEYLITYIILTEFHLPEQGTVNTLDLSAFSLPVLCLLSQVLYWAESEAHAPEDLTARAWWIRDHWSHFHGNMNRIVDEIVLRQRGQRAGEGRRLLGCEIFTTPALSTLRKSLMKELAEQYGEAPDPTDRAQCLTWMQELERLYQGPVFTELAQRGFYSTDREKEP